MIGRMSRWVERRGCRVEFGNIAFGFPGKPYVYEFKNEDQAKRFSAEVKRNDQSGMPVAVPQDHWSQKYFKGHG